MTIVHCRCCHRDERWSAGPDGKPVIAVAVPGGVRLPVVDAVEAWRTLRSAREGTTGPVVAICAGCGQPMIASDGAFPALPSWTIHATGGDLTIGAAITGPAGVLDADAAERWLVAQYRRSLVPTAANVFGPLMMIPLIGPVIAWLIAVTFVVTFFATGFGADPWVAVKLAFGAFAAVVAVGATVGALSRAR